MTITERQYGCIFVLEIRGAISGRSAADALLAAITRGAHSGRRALIVDLGAVASIDLNGLGALLDAAHELRAVGGTLILTRVARRIHDVIVITRLLTLFDTRDTVDDAVATLTGVPPDPPAARSAPPLGTTAGVLRSA